jgi:DNA replication protein DnaC
VPRLLAEIKETYEDGAGRSYQQLFRALCQVELLHLDDLGAEKRTDWVIEQLYSIVNERWQDQRSIVVTTNLLDLDELREQLGPRTVSRLAEMCGTAIPIMGADLRMSYPS